MLELSTEKLAGHDRIQNSLARCKAACKNLTKQPYWLELLVDGGMIKAEKLRELRKENDELIAIFVTSVKTARTKK